jgi:hypothetical protein
MDQYRWIRSVHAQEFIEKHPEFKLLQRGITDIEYRYAIECAKKQGLHRGFPL